MSIITRAIWLVGPVPPGAANLAGLGLGLGLGWAGLGWAGLFVTYAGAWTLSLGAYIDML